MAHLGGTTAQIQQQIDQNEITAFNNNFYAYTAKECTIYDVLSVVNMAKSFNDQEGYTLADTEYFINVTLNGSSVVDTLKIQDIDSKIKNKSDTDYGSTVATGSFGNDYILTKYYATVTTSKVSGRVNSVIFSTNKPE